MAHHPAARCKIDLDTALPKQLRGDIKHGERLQSEKVEFDEAGRFNPFHIELRDGHVGFRVSIERHELTQRTISDHNAGGVGGSVPGQTFKALRNIESARHHRILISKSLQLRLAGDCSGERDRGCGILRHQLGQLVDLPIGHLQDAPDVAQYASRL